MNTFSIGENNPIQNLSNFSHLPVTIQKVENKFKITAFPNNSEKFNNEGKKIPCISYDSCVSFIQDSLDGFKFKNVHVNLRKNWSEKDLKMLSEASIETIKITSATLDHFKILFPQKSEIPLWKNLTSLNLIFNCMGDEGVKIITACESLHNLEDLDLRENLIHDMGAEEIAQHKNWKNLKSLSLGINKIGDKGATAIIKAIAKKRFPLLTALYLHWNLITDKGIKDIVKVKTLNNLQELYLTGNRIGDEGAIEIIENDISKNLNTLTLRKNKFHKRTEEKIKNSKLSKTLKTFSYTCEVENNNLVPYTIDKKRFEGDIDVVAKLK